MVWTLKEDDHPDCFKFIINSFNEKDLKTFHYFNQRLADLTDKREKVKYGYLGDHFFMYMESDLEQKIENKPNYRANKNYLIQYVTPFFNIIVEGMLRAKEQKILIGVYDYSQSGFEEYLPLFDEDFNQMNRSRIEKIKCVEGFYYKFNIDFLRENKINPFYITEDEKYFLLFNEPFFK